MLVPFAIEEANALYQRHMHVSLALWQMWKTRDECITAESGLEHLPGIEGATESLNKLQFKVRFLQLFMLHLFEMFYNLDRFRLGIGSGNVT